MAFSFIFTVCTA